MKDQFKINTKRVFNNIISKVMQIQDKIMVILSKNKIYQINLKKNNSKVKYFLIMKIKNKIVIIKILLIEVVYQVKNKTLKIIFI
jgi:hypothetical protein